MFYSRNLDKTRKVVKHTVQKRVFKTTKIRIPVREIDRNIFQILNMNLFDLVSLCDGVSTFVGY